MEKGTIYTALFVLAVMTMPYIATSAEYGTDVLEQGNGGGSGGAKTFDTEASVSGKFAVDIWLRNINCSTNMIAGGFYIVFDPAKISYVSAMGYNPPWGDSVQIITCPAGAGTLRVIVLELSGVPPDGDSDIIVGKVTFQPVTFGDTQIQVKTIPGFNTWVCGSDPMDPLIPTSTLNINAVENTCRADCNHDGKVNTTDLGIMKIEFFRTNCLQ